MNIKEVTTEIFKKESKSKAFYIDKHLFTTDLIDFCYEGYFERKNSKNSEIDKELNDNEISLYIEVLKKRIYEGF